MLLTNYIFAISAALAFKDYFPNTDEVFEKVKKVKEDFDSNCAQASKWNEIQVISLAVHGGEIELETEKFSKDLFNKVKDTRKDSVLYSFISNIDTIESGNYYNGRCIPTHCCKKIKKTVKRDGNNVEVIEDNRRYKEDTCRKFKLDEKLRKELENKLESNKGVCKFKEVCYLNAAHVTSEFFRTEKLKKTLPGRYPVSFHGFQDNNDKNGYPVDVVLGGLSKQKYELAKEYHKLTNGKINIAICRSGNNCKVYDPNNDDFDTRTPVEASGLSGSHENNFVNLGKHKCGLQLELSTTFRKSKGEKSKYWGSLIDSIFNTLPKKKKGESEQKEKERICDDKKFYVKSSTDTDD